MSNELDEKQCAYCKRFLPKHCEKNELTKNKLYDEKDNLIGYCCIDCLYKYYLGDY